MPETAKERNARELAEFQAADARARAREAQRAATKPKPAAKAPASPTFKPLEAAAKPPTTPKGVISVIHDRNARLACADADDVEGCVKRLRQQQTSDSSN